MLRFWKTRMAVLVTAAALALAGAGATRAQGFSFYAGTGGCGHHGFGPGYGFGAGYGGYGSGYGAGYGSGYGAGYGSGYGFGGGPYSSYYGGVPGGGFQAPRPYLPPTVVLPPPTTVYRYGFRPFPLPGWRLRSPGCW